jgi:hypothetical protein
MLYPSYSEGVSAATKLISIIKGGETAERKAETAKCIYTVEGVALNFAFGDPDAVADIMQAACDDDSAFCDLADTLQAQYGSGDHQCFSAAGDKERKINWVKLLELLKTLAPIILPLIV